MSGLQRGILCALLIEAGLALGFYGLMQAVDAASRADLSPIHFARSE